MTDSSITDLISKIKKLGISSKPILIAIEGYGGSGKSTLSDKLKNLLPNSDVVRMDSFIIKEAARNAQISDETFDRKRLEKQVLKPAKLGKKVRYQTLEWASNKLSHYASLPDVDYLIVEGISSYHPDIEKYYDFKIWVNTPIEVATERGRLRDKGNENEVMWGKWAESDIRYQQRYRPDARSDIEIKND